MVKVNHMQINMFCLLELDIHMDEHCGYHVKILTVT
jgi:hypothetical protein